MEVMPEYNYNHRRMRPDRGRNKPVFGILLAIAGLFLLLEMFEVLPDIRYALRSFGWPLILIVIGIIIGIKHQFRNLGSWVLIAIGLANLTPAFEIAGVASNKMIWPLALIGIGLFLMFRGRKPDRFPGRQGKFEALTNTSDRLNIDVTFGGRKEIITSKNFRGGRAQATFGGVELNLMQAEIADSPAVLDMRVSFSGVEVIVPSSWEVRSEIAPTMGSFEDKRVLRPAADGLPAPVLIIRGHCSFGNIEVKSY